MVRHIGDKVGRLEHGRCHACRTQGGSRNQAFYVVTMVTLAGECGLVKPCAIAFGRYQDQTQCQSPQTGE
jgi:hypothetical protein